MDKKITRVIGSIIAYAFVVGVSILVLGLLLRMILWVLGVTYAHC